MTERLDESDRDTVVMLGGQDWQEVVAAAAV